MPSRQDPPPSLRWFLRYDDMKVDHVGETEGATVHEAGFRSHKRKSVRVCFPNLKADKTTVGHLGDKLKN